MGGDVAQCGCGSVAELEDWPSSSMITGSGTTTVQRPESTREENSKRDDRRMFVSTNNVEVRRAMLFLRPEGEMSPVLLEDRK